MSVARGGGGGEQGSFLRTHFIASARAPCPLHPLFPRPPHLPFTPALATLPAPPSARARASPPFPAHTTTYPPFAGEDAAESAACEDVSGGDEDSLSEGAGQGLPSIGSLHLFTSSARQRPQGPAMVPAVAPPAAGDGSRS